MTARILPAPGHRRGIQLGTGIALQDAHEDFRRARRAHIAGRAVHRLSRPSTGQSHPRTLSGDHALAWTPSRLRVVRLDAIVGTVEATSDFDAEFRPPTTRI